MGQRTPRSVVWMAAALCAIPAWTRQGQEGPEVPPGSVELPALTADTFGELRELVLPTADELAWKQVGWRASLWEGVIEAHESRRPILLWAMNGHPLGCT